MMPVMISSRHIPPKRPFGLVHQSSLEGFRVKTYTYFSGLAQKIEISYAAECT